MKHLKAFASDDFKKEAMESGFFQCPTCGIVWFGKPDVQECPVAPHGKPVQVAVLCRKCDLFVPISHFAQHLTETKHDHGNLVH